MYSVRTPSAKTPFRPFRATVTTTTRRHRSRSLRPASAFLLALGVACTSVATAQTAHFIDAEAVIRGGLENPAGVVVDAAGKIYFAVSATNQVLLETPSVNGYMETTIGSGLNQPQGIAIDAQGTLYIADTNNHRVLKETPSGGVYTQSIVASGFEAPVGVAVDASGNLFITDSDLNVVFKETVSGSTYVKSTVVSGLSGPFGIAVDGSGNLYLCDTGNERALKETRSGSSYIQSTIGSGFRNPGGIAVDLSGNVYIADGASSSVFKETLSGSTYSQSTLPVVSYLSGPNGLAVDSGGNVYITDEQGLASSAQGQLFKEMPDGANFGSVSVANTSPEISLLFKFDTGGVLGNVNVVTQGAENLDFISNGGLTCIPTFSYTAGQTCATTVTLSPTVPGFRYGAVNLVDNSGNTFATGYVYGNGVGPQANFKASGVSSTQKVVPFSSAGESSPYAIAVDTTGSVYIADSNNNRVLKETLSGGAYTESEIGSGLNSPAQIAIDGSGNVYIADSGNGRVVKETLNAGVYSQTVVNSGYSSPNGVAVDGDGNVYVADTLNDRVLKLTLIGNSYTQAVLPASGLSTVFGLAVDGAGNVYIADTGNDRVVKETPSGTSYTQSVVASGLNDPFGVAVDGFGDVFISQFYASYIREERPAAAGQYSETVPPTTGLNAPYGIAVDGLGNVYVSDVGNEQVYKEDYADAPSITFDSTNVGSTSADTPIYVELFNIGNAPMYFPVPATGTNPGVSSNFTLNPSAPFSCPLVPAGAMAAGMLNANSSCSLAVGFSPTAPGTLTGSIAVTDDSLNAGSPGYATQSILLSGIGIGPQAITFPPPASPVDNGVPPITLSATGGASGNPVVFSIVSGPGTVSGPNGATLTITGVGTVVVAANQAGNADYTAAPQVTQTIVVNPSPAATLTSPTPGLSTILGTTNVSFQWTTAVGATEYQLNLSAIAAGDTDLYTYKGTATAAVAAKLPGNGVKVYATLYSKINGAWLSNNYVYTESGIPTPATLKSPTPGLSTKLGTTNVAFQWTTGVDVSDYQLNLSAIAAGDTDLYSYKGTATSAVAAMIPANGVEVFARLYSKINGVWQYNDYVYTESGTPTLAALTSPTPGLSTILGTTSVQFQWTSGTDVSDYQLNLSGIAAGDSDLYTYKGTALSATASALPANGVKVYARLYSKISGTWLHNDYVYTEGGTPAPATLTSPAPGLGTILGTTSATFQWTAGIAVTDYQLNLSAVAVGDSDLYTYKGTALTATPPALPANGAEVYARLYSKINGAWQYKDYVYTEGGTPTRAALTSPTPGLSTILGTSGVVFQWTAGIGVTDYQLNLSAIAAGDSDLYLYKGPATSATAPALPANGVKVYARLYSKINGVWQYNDYVYTEQ